jgi:hypothetical protein
MARTNKEQADLFLANMLKAEEQNGKNLAELAQKGGNLSQMVSDNKDKAAKVVQDLEGRLNSLSSGQRAEPGYAYLGTDGAFRVDEAVPAGTPGGVAVVYPNPDFFDRTLPPWQAQTICASIGSGPRTQESSLYPTILRIWDSVDWDAMAKILR